MGLWADWHCTIQLGALASCYTTTFETLAEYSKLKYTDLPVEAEGVIRKAEKGYSFGEVVIRSNLTISQEVEQERAIKLLHKTKDLCLVSRALVAQPQFEPVITIALPVVGARA